MTAIERSLKVAYELQHDNASGQGYRECFSSTCGAIARYWGKVRNDDEYNLLRIANGDTTSTAAQLRTLRQLGLSAAFIQTASPDLIRREIDAGRPLAVGWIHQGPLPSGLRGDGHWSVISGYDSVATIHQDPYGEADMIRGGYVNRSGGRSVRYSWKNWRQRWEVVPVGSGWRHLAGNGWAVTVRP
jgi:hypothetical protein